MKTRQDIGELLKKAREGRGLTIDVVYKKTHIHPRILRSLENGVEEKSLSKVYQKAFVRKYSDFLGLDSDTFVKEYEEQIPPDSEQIIYIESRKESTFEIEKYKRPLLIAVAVVLCFIFAFMGLMKVKRVVSRSIANLSQRIGRGRTAQKKPKQSKVPGKSIVGKLSVEQRAGMISLSVASNDEVWISVKKDEEIVFNGLLPKNSKEWWYADEELVLRVGKLEALKFTLNDKDIGKIGWGVKDIVVDKKGIKVEGKYIDIVD